MHVHGLARKVYDAFAVAAVNGYVAARRVIGIVRPDSRQGRSDERQRKNQNKQREDKSLSIHVSRLLLPMGSMGGPDENWRAGKPFHTGPRDDSSYAPTLQGKYLDNVRFRSGRA